MNLGSGGSGGVAAPSDTWFLSRSTTMHSSARSSMVSARWRFSIPQRKGMGAERIGTRKRGSTGMYAWLHRIGNSRLRSISQHVVRRLSWLDVTRTCLSSASAVQTVRTFSTSRHWKRWAKGRLTQAMGMFPGGLHMLMTLSSIVVWTWNEPGGGAGSSLQKFVMYRSTGRVRTDLSLSESDVTMTSPLRFSGAASPPSSPSASDSGGHILDMRWSWVRYSRNATRYGCTDSMTRHLGRYTTCTLRLLLSIAFPAASLYTSTATSIPSQTVRHVPYIFCPEPAVVTK
mmetsp:Transcript_36994/g.88508  ORF Transcript_36994/g.88508 Transcript_36994/m.88508 type:complete len:287 (+) Transcript_36994:2688-3548(+)